MEKTYGSLDKLSPGVLDSVLSFLTPGALVSLHAATGTDMPLVRQRLLSMRCGRHWLELSRRMPPPSSIVALEAAATAVASGEEGDGIDTDDSDRETDAGRYRLASKRKQVLPCSKHDLLQILCSQIQHINDVAAFVYHWSACNADNWLRQLQAVGLSQSAFYLTHRDRMPELLSMVKCALSLGYYGYSDALRNRKDPHNHYTEIRALVDLRFNYHFLFAFHDQLAFVCTLRRLQQLQSQAVLARLHSVFSRCCRYDLLLMTRVLRLEDMYSSSVNDVYQATTQEVPANDVLSAFAQSEPLLRPVVLSLTARQRNRLTAYIHNIVGSA